MQQRLYAWQQTIWDSCICDADNGVSVVTGIDIVISSGFGKTIIAALCHLYGHAIGVPLSAWEQHDSIDRIADHFGRKAVILVVPSTNLAGLTNQIIKLARTIQTHMHHTSRIWLLCSSLELPSDVDYSVDRVYTVDPTNKHLQAITWDAQVAQI